MKPTVASFFVVISTFVLLPPLISKAQCSSSNISIVSGWPLSYGSTGNDAGRDIEVIDLDNNPNTYDGYVAVGAIDKGTDGSNIYVFRVNENGSVLYSADSDGGTHLDGAGYAVEQTSTDSILICGVTTVSETGSPRKNYWVARLDMSLNMGAGSCGFICNHQSVLRNHDLEDGPLCSQVRSRI